MVFILRRGPELLVLTFEGAYGYIENSPKGKKLHDEVISSFLCHDKIHFQSTLGSWYIVCNHTKWCSSHDARLLNIKHYLSQCWLLNHQWGLVVYTSGQFHMKCSRYGFENCYPLMITTAHPRAQWVKQSGTKPNLVAKILATKIGNLPSDCNHL